jgi:hypothetical protein
MTSRIAVEVANDKKVMLRVLKKERVQGGPKIK